MQVTTFQFEGMQLVKRSRLSGENPRLVCQKAHKWCNRNPATSWRNAVTLCATRKAKPLSPWVAHSCSDQPAPPTLLATSLCMLPSNQRPRAFAQLDPQDNHRPWRGRPWKSALQPDRGITTECSLISDPPGSQSWGLVYQLLTATSISIGAWLVVDIVVLYMILYMYIILISY